MSASCRHCGESIPDGSRFCPQCGMRLAEGESTPTAVIPPAGATARDRLAVAADRARGVLDVLRTGVGAGRAIGRLRAERERLLDRRRSLVLALGEAVYRQDGQETSSVRAELEVLDAAIAEKEAEMQRIAGDARRKAARTRFETGPTQVIEPSPMPSPADPPEPARVPEPYPSPGEADPPEPARVPEPYPPPDEADPPEPARIPEPGGRDDSHNIR